ncbi:conserved hypothetical protein [Parvibaculum lavamentivorans DS-1]|uniref:DUF1993 domain-containing protein n=1 Tax=Parvibaculum lavamentivorans (strain DS-1 / DSM 13023 / NCIMB 13966) TaxID=402881 RepID=A7HXN0_PARL1|nr:DUF1993 domain-containing protein [Parvibaculum lavamentivorans]ABS64663.1 conserved hypothetical protein [Parvibaculum lavamentivorans DS-1]
MSLSLYEIAVPNYLQTLTAVSGFLKKGAAFCEEQGTNPNDIVAARVIDDMLPFSFQIASIAHHSFGAVEGVQSGTFSPPKDPGTHDYASLQKLVDDAKAGLEKVTPDALDAFQGKDVIFHLGKHQLPFTAENFLLSFSFPNFYFHASTAYDILRARGVKIGKADFIGPLRMKM